VARKLCLSERLEPFGPTARLRIPCRIASFDRRAIAAAKSLVNSAILEPAHALVTGEYVVKDGVPRLELDLWCGDLSGKPGLARLFGAARGERWRATSAPSVAEDIPSPAVAPLHRAQ
jgi:hypothetical protein